MYGFQVRIGGSFDEAVDKVIAALSQEGLASSPIDVQAALKKKLGVDRRPYRIFGACNPPLAHRALEAVRTSDCCCAATSWCASRRTEATPPPSWIPRRYWRWPAGRRSPRWTGRFARGSTGYGTLWLEVCGYAQQS